MVMGLTTGIWVSAQVRLCDRAFIPATIVRHGNDEAGTVLVKINRFEQGVTVFAQATSLDGEPAWSRGTGPYKLDGKIVLRCGVSLKRRATGNHCAGRTVVGSIVLLARRTSKCRRGSPVPLELPTLAISWPLRTVSPFLTSSTSLLPYAVM